MVSQKKSILEKFEPQLELGNFVMLMYMCYQYAKLWIAPEVGDSETIFQMAGLMGFEFVMIHSGVFMAVMPKKISLFIFVPFYGLFALAFNQIIGGENLVFKIYLVVVFHRMRFAFFNASEELKNNQIAFSAIAAMAYFFLLIAVCIGNTLVPAFGLSAENLSHIGYDSAKTHGGILLDNPETAMCLGTSYYLLLALYVFPYKINFRKWFN